MKVQTWLITGATGLVGTALQKALQQAGHRVRTLGRSPQDTSNREVYQWDPNAGTLDRRALDNVDVVVHLAGASVGQRWTQAHKRAILESRVQGTTLLRDELAQCGFAGTWIQASAVGFYGNTSTPIDEESPKGEGFLADVVEAWERAAVSSTPQAWRLLHLRLGLVLSGQGGTLDRLWPIYRLGLGAPLGSGEQAMSWIHLDDVVSMILWLAQSSEAVGCFNATAPKAVSNREFSQTLAQALERPHWAPAVPAWALRAAMGEMASLLLEGQNTVPQRLLDLGFTWRHPDLLEALQSCASSR
jgi:uncharacterized protein (TIGR01777 family)